MYARSTRFHGRPDNIDAVIRFVKNEAGPMLDKTEGCRGLSMLCRPRGRAVHRNKFLGERGGHARER